MIEFVDKKNWVILCQTCEGTGKVFDRWLFQYSAGTRNQLKECPYCEGAGTIRLKKPTKETA